MKLFTCTTLLVMFLAVNLLILDVLAAPDTQRADNESQEERGARLRKGLSARRGSRPRTSRRMKNKDGGEELNNEDKAKMSEIAKPVAVIQPEMVTEPKPGNFQKDRNKVSSRGNGNGTGKSFSFTTAINSLAKQLQRILLSLSLLLNARRKSSESQAV